MLANWGKEAAVKDETGLARAKVVSYVKKETFQRGQRMFLMLAAKLGNGHWFEGIRDQ